MPQSCPKRHRKSTKNTISFHVSHRCLSTSETGQDDRAGARLSRPARPVAPRRHRHRARNEMGGRHHAWSNLAGIRLPGGRHGLLPGKGSSGARSPVTCAPDSSPRPWPWPRRACPPIRGVTVFHSDRGARCTSAEYTKFMTGRGILPSVGRTGMAVMKRNRIFRGFPVLFRI